MPTENIRSMLVIALCVVTFLMWQAWMRDYGPKPVQEPGPQPAMAPADVPAGPAAPAEPGDLQPPAPGAPAAPDIAAPEIAALAPTASADGIKVRTDVLTAEIDAGGGAIYQLELLGYPVSLEEPNTPFTLLRGTRPGLFIAESGLLGSNGEIAQGTQLVADQREYVLEDGADTLDVRFSLTSPSGIEVAKVYTFKRDSYAIDVRYEVKNNSETPWSGRVYGQFWRAVPQDSGSAFVYTYTGGVLSSPEKPYQKIDFDDMSEQNLAAEFKGGWAAMIQHYFAAAWIPDTDAVNHYYTKVRGGPEYAIGVYTDNTVPAGQSATFGLTGYTGPKVQARMDKVEPNLARTVDYGWLWFIAQPLFWMLQKIHGVMGNWGWSIVVLTLLIKLAFFHLSATSYKSMARMRKLGPRMTELRERYGTDKARMNQAMMELYKTEKINPLGGCLPILVQIPVFIALYWTLLESVELRQAPFMLWIEDMSQRDPYFVLPIIMGVTMFVQQKLNPAPPDPVQAKVMMALPFVFTFFFMTFPSGLVLYWIVNNILSIAQQWVITRRIAPNT